MPHDPITRTRRRAASDDYRDALKRLVEGLPSDGDLQGRLKNGTLRINVATVAVEAKRSRVALARKAGGSHGDIRAAIEAEKNRLVSMPAAEEADDGPNTREIILGLRREIGHLKDEIRQVGTQLVRAKRIIASLQDDIKALNGGVVGNVLGEAARSVRSAARSAARNL